MKNEEYILYGAGAEAERFIFCNSDMLGKIKLCIDNNKKEFYNIPVCKLEEVKLTGENQIIVAAGYEKMYHEMKQNLINLGLVEFEDFIWTKVFRKKIVVINANCYGLALISYLQQSSVFAKKFMVYPVPPIQLNGDKEIPVNLLKNLDVYIHQDIQENNKFGYKLSDAYICPQLRPDVINICIPNFVGMGKWMFPSLGRMDRVIHTLSGQDHVVYRDYVLDEAVNKCGSLSEYRAFWMSYKFDISEHKGNFNEFMNKLCMREKNWDIKMSHFIREKYRSIPCFIDADHPSKYVMKEVGRQVAAILDLNDIDDENYESYLGTCTPIMPDVLSYFNMDFVVPPEVKKEYLGKKVEIEVDDYIGVYLWWYHEIIID